MKPLSVIIPSRKASNLVPCIEALKRNQPDVHVIVVNDGLDPNWRPVPAGIALMEIPGQQPFIFSRNINLGIEAAGEDDVILLNDDAQLETPGGFRALQAEQLAHPECGLVSSSTNGGSILQLPQLPRFRYEKVMVPFICVFIPRLTIQKLGLLDERFGVRAEATTGPRGYGCDDDDYCWRVRIQEKMKLGISDACFVDHKKLVSTFRGDPARPADVLPHERLFAEKWGRSPRNP